MMHAMKPARKLQPPPARLSVSFLAALMFVALVSAHPVKLQSQTVPQSSDVTVNAADTADTPVSVAIVVETSSRVAALLPAIRRTGVMFTQNMLGADGEAALIGYNDEVDKLLDFTNNDDAVEKAVGDIQMGTSGARLYDALSQAVALLQTRPSSHRRVIIVLGEAVNTGGEEKIGSVISQARLANVTIYSVGLSSTAAQVRGPQEPTAPVYATPPGIFALPPMPGTPQTPDTEALREGNVDLGAAVKWAGKHATAPLRDNPIELAATATGGSYQPTLRDRSIAPAINKIGGDLRLQD